MDSGEGHPRTAQEDIGASRPPRPCARGTSGGASRLPGRGRSARAGGVDRSPADTRPGAWPGGRAGPVPRRCEGPHAHADARLPSGPVTRPTRDPVPEGIQGDRDRIRLDGACRRRGRVRSPPRPASAPERQSLQCQPGFGWKTLALIAWRTSAIRSSPRSFVLLNECREPTLMDLIDVRDEEKLHGGTMRTPPVISPEGESAGGVVGMTGQRKNSTLACSWTRATIPHCGSWERFSTSRVRTRGRLVDLRPAQSTQNSRVASRPQTVISHRESKAGLQAVASAPPQPNTTRGYSTRCNPFLLLVARGSRPFATDHVE